MKAKIVQTEKYSLTSYDYKSLLIGLGITLLGAVLTYSFDYLSKMEWGKYSIFLVPLFSLLVNVVKKFIGENKYIK